MQYALNDLAGTLAALERLEAARKFSAIPAALLESAWAGEAQTEAVIDAVLIALTGSDNNAYAHARHVGEWCARIAAELPLAPQAGFLRRCGVLADVDPRTLERVRELRDCAPAVRAFQTLRLAGDAAGGVDGAAARIIAVADEFDSLVFYCAHNDRYRPADALRMLLTSADERTRSIVQALRRALRNAPPHLFSAA